MDTSPQKYISRLLEGSNAKYVLLQDMLALTRRQSGVINEDGIDSLDKLISDKQSLIDRINKLDEEFNVYFVRLKHELKVDSLDQVQTLPGFKDVEELKKVIRQIMDLIKEISALEEQNKKNAKILLDNIGGEIKKMNQAKKVTNAYNPAPVQTVSYFIDKKK